MDKERWRKVEEIFQGVADCEPADRPAFLAEACSGDEALRREVESLLAHEVFDTFIQQPINGMARSLASATKNDLIGAQLGHYRITELIGEGGMGTVFAAVRDDELFNQKVAVKVVKRGMDSGFVLSRFQAERRILASLDHPNIARLIDGGSTPDGRPYFVMEFIEGQPLTEYCTARDLSIPDRIKLFRQICSAVQYAHQKLIAHRDIKPSNILITGDGVPKLLDFGIAKLLDPTQSEVDPARTATMMRMMTPDYASPEQVRGLQITTATDIYSLGAVLYELLTGARAHRLETYTPTEIERVICETEVERPSTLAERRKDEGGRMKSGARLFHSSSFILHRSDLRGDLDNIILMAMRKEPVRRYASVEQFSDDLRRHLEKLPISARPDTIRYRAGKFVRRHRIGVVATALIIACLLGGLIATNYQARRAERRFQQVRKLANTFLFEVNGEVQKLPGSTKARALIIKTSLEYLDNLSQEAGDDPTLQMELARAYEAVGSVQGYPYEQNLGDSAAALASFQKAQAIYDSLTKDDPSNQRLLETLSNLHLKLGLLHNDDGNVVEAERNYREAMRVIERMYAARLQPSVSLVTAAYYRMGEVERLSGDLQAALQNQRRGFEIAADWAKQHPGDSAQQLLSASYARMGGILLRTGDLDAALENYTQALRVYQDLAERFPQSDSLRRTLASRYESVADVLGDPDDLNVGRPEEALGYYRKSLAIAEGFFAMDANDAQAKRNLAIAQLWVAKMMRDSDPAQAAGLYRKSLAMVEALYNSAPQNFQFRHELALSHRGLGTALWRLNQFPEALAHLRQAKDLHQINFDQNPSRTWLHRGLCRTYTVIGNVLLKQGDTNGALENYRQAQAITEKLLTIHPNDLFLRRDEAYCHDRFGYFHLAAAGKQQLSREERISEAREALAQYHRGLQIWSDWQARGVAVTYANIRRNEAARAVKECEAVLTRLTSGRWK